MTIQRTRSLEGRISFADAAADDHGTTELSGNVRLACKLSTAGMDAPRSGEENRSEAKP